MVTDIINGMRIPFLLLLVSALLMGCGGSGDKNNGYTSDSLVPEQYMTALNNAVQSRDVDSIRSQIATEYLDDCENKALLVNAILDVLGTGGTVEFTAAPITNKSVNVNLGRAEFNGGFTIRVIQGDVERMMSRTGHMVLRRDNSPWQLYGEQDCN
jgi:hypothetical protein